MGVEVNEKGMISIILEDNFFEKKHGEMAEGSTEMS